jgi:ribosome maturation factor RimP
MQSQRWIFTSPGGEDEYKKPSIARQHYGDTIALKTKQKMEKKETENGELKQNNVHGV